MKSFLVLAFILLASRVEAETFVAGSQDYSLSYYADSDGFSVESAISELGLPASAPRAFRIRVYNRSKIVYADSWGSRLLCSEGRGGITCSYRGSFRDDTTGARCAITAAYVFAGSRRPGAWDAILHEELKCSDGWYRVTEYSGRPRVRVVR